MEDLALCKVGADFLNQSLAAVGSACSYLDLEHGYGVVEHLHLDHEGAAARPAGRRGR